MATRAVSLAAAAMSAAWAIYNVALLVSTGVFWMPGNSAGGVGRWEETASAPWWVPGLVMTIYCAAPLFFVYLSTRERNR